MEVDPVSYYKMLFVYRAVEDGWAVRKLRTGKFQFKKPTIQCSPEIYLEEYLHRFIAYNLCISHLSDQIPWIHNALAQLEQSNFSCE